MKKILLLCPVYNEAKTLEFKVEQIVNWSKINLKKYNWKFVIIDNGSTDATRLGYQLEKKYKNFRYIRIKEKGRGAALKWAWQKQAFDYSIYMDLDISTDLKHTKEVLCALDSGNDLVVGSRWMKTSVVKNRNMVRTILSFGYKTLVQLLTGSKISDFQCGFKGLRKALVRENLFELKDNDWFLDTELILSAQKYDYKIIDIPVVWTDDPDSKVYWIKDSIKMLLSLLRWISTNR